MSARAGALVAVLAVAFAALPAAASDPERASADPERAPAEVREQVLAERMKLPRAPALAWQGDDVVAGRLIVTARDEHAARRLADRHGGEVLAGRTVLLDAPRGREAARASALASDDAVLAVEPDRVHEWFADPNDPRYDEQWAHTMANASAAWEHTTGATSVKVAVLDSGVDGTHEDLAANIVAQAMVHSGSVTERSSIPTNNACVHNGQPLGHGTAVAGVAGAVGNNGVGVAGAAWRVGLVDVMIGDPNIECLPTDNTIISGLEYVATAHSGAAAVNLSLGRPGATCPPAMQDAVDRVRANGTAVVAASGNTGGFYRMQPAGCDGVIAVGAVGPDGRLASYSSRNRYLDLVAPGGDASTCTSASCILTTSLGNGYAPFQGTSFSAPYVAGIAALLRTLNPQLTPDEVESVLEHSAQHPDGANVHDERYGWGLVDAGAAAAHVASGDDIPAPRAHPLPRWAAPGDRTEPATQAVAVSNRLFEDRGAFHAVLARDDLFADALPGSGLAYGLGPLLFTSRAGSLSSVTRAELRRVLPTGATVYLLGGPEALDERLDDEITALGFEPVRLAGATREFTAVAIAYELERVFASVGTAVWPEALLATRANWPDAVAAGSFAAIFGAPVLLTSADRLHEATEAFLIDSRGVYLGLLGVGGPVVLHDEVIDRAGDALAAEWEVRLAGAARDGTAIAVAELVEDTLHEFFGGIIPPPPSAIAVNLDRADGYAHTLSASTVAHFTISPFVPLRQESDGTVFVPDATTGWACAAPPWASGDQRGRQYDALLAGGTDLLPAGVSAELQGLLDGTDSRC